MRRHKGDAIADLAVYAVPMLKNLGPDRLKSPSQFIGWTAEYHQPGKRGDLMQGTREIADVL
jgi:hypothetical protein